MFTVTARSGGKAVRDHAKSLLKADSVSWRSGVTRYAHRDGLGFAVGRKPNAYRFCGNELLLNYAQAQQQPQGLNGEASTYFHANGWFHGDAIQRRGRKAHHRPVPPVKSISDWTSKRSST